MINSSFSLLYPTTQLFWDSTSLGALKTCPRYYKFSIIDGWTSRHQSVHLAFGAWYHAALERYDHSRVSGADHEEALDQAVKYVLEETWNRELGRPWLSDEPTKTRWTLLRTVVWYLDHFQHDTMQTLVLANGKPAVELSFRFDTGATTRSGENLVLCGHLDRVANLGDEIYIVDRKTTKGALDQRYFDAYTPDNQFSLYSLAGQVVLNLPVKGIVVDAAQIGVNFSRFERRVAPRSSDFLEEWFKEALVWMDLAEDFAHRGVWPANEKACGNYGGCPFRQVCAKSPSVREEWLASGFAKRVWDPRQVRGEI